MLQESKLALEGNTTTDPIDQYIEVRVSRLSSRRQNDEVERMRSFCNKNIGECTAKLAIMEADYQGVGSLEKIATERYLKTIQERGINIMKQLNIGRLMFSPKFSIKGDRNLNV